jgi:formamidopyrimidine-DNA glycosylase
MWLVTDPAALLARLGPEPLGDDFAPALFAGRLAGRTAPIKALLLDQAVVAGVGNIYADEALFRAGIHPRRPAGSLREGEILALQQAIREVLTAGIAAGGSSLGVSGVQNYVRPTGNVGEFQAQHHAYGRTGAPCHRCGTPIERLVIAQRSSHFCPNCQPLTVLTIG